MEKFSVHTTRKRMLSVQRSMKEEGKDYRAFEILNLGKYQAQHFVKEYENLREEDAAKKSLNKEKQFIGLILNAYNSEPVDGFKTFHGKKSWENGQCWSCELSIIKKACRGSHFRMLTK